MIVIYKLNTIRNVDWAYLYKKCGGSDDSGRQLVGQDPAGDDNGEMNRIILHLTNKIYPLSHDGLTASTLPHGHEDSTQYNIFTRKRPGKKHCVSLKPIARTREQFSIGRTELQTTPTLLFYFKVA